MAYRLAIGGIGHETNTYCSSTTPLDDFEIFKGDEMRARWEGTRTVLGGMLDACSELGVDPVLTMFAYTQPSGTIQTAAYSQMKEQLLGLIKDALPLHAVALELHGAGVVEGVDDLEGDLCAAVRQLVGQEVRIVLTLDLHGNITQAMADAVDLPLGYHEYPHTDLYERGHEAISSLPRILDGSLRPVTHVETVPMLLAPASTLPGTPGAEMNAVARRLEEQPGMVDLTVFHGFPYADVPLVGVHVVSTADRDPELARASAKKVASWIWDHREEFVPDVLSPEEAVAAALDVEGGPVVINDTADNSGGGAPGDATHVLRAMIDAELENACFSFIYDPEVAEQAHRAGSGATIDISLGGKTDDLHGKPIEANAYIKTVTDGNVILRSFASGSLLEHGKMARLVIGGIDVLVGSKRTQTFDPEVFLLHGIDVMRYRIVVVKSSNHFRAGFGPIAKKIITADSPGLTTLRVEVFPRTRKPGPLWPIDPEANYGG